jgi:RHS repeat-associated protein
VNYTFDALHRLSTAVTNGSTNYPKWGLSWTYDRYGNRTAQTVTAGSAFSGSPTVDPNTNRISALGTANFFYDLSGNLTQDDLYKYVYDAESRLVQLQQLSGTVIATYSLDGNGLRVIKVQPSAPSPNRIYSLYDGTDLISEFSDNSTTTYTAGTTPAQAPADSISLLLYHFGDHLTTRMTADNFASNASYEGHYPFGETWYDTGMAYPSVTKKFTSYNKDTEASSAFLNYAIFRQHSARLGRFHMADPILGRTGNPQSLNRFSYGLSDPINKVDPIGLMPRVEIPADWPCDPTSISCGCDPFGNDPFGFGFAPVYGGGSGGGDDGSGGCTLGAGGGGPILAGEANCECAGGGRPNRPKKPLLSYFCFYDCKCDNPKDPYYHTPLLQLLYKHILVQYVKQYGRSYTFCPQSVKGKWAYTINETTLIPGVNLDTTTYVLMYLTWVSEK